MEWRIEALRRSLPLGHLHDRHASGRRSGDSRSTINDFTVSTVEDRKLLEVSVLAHRCDKRLEGFGTRRVGDRRHERTHVEAPPPELCIVVFESFARRLKSHHIIANLTVRIPD